MRKVILGLAAAAVIAIAGYFGFEFYVGKRIADDVDAAFAAVRQSGAKATHGKVAFDLWTRTITIDDISGDFADPPANVKIGRVVAAGVSRHNGVRFGANQIEASDVAVSGTIGMQGGLRTTYQAPRIEVTDYAGPAGPMRQLNASQPGDVYRFALEHFATVTAKSLIAPTVTVKFAPTGAAPGMTGDYTYSDVAVRDIKDGKIAAATLERMSFSATVTVGSKAESITGDISKIAAYDFDAAATLTVIDPAHEKDDKYYRVYRQMTAGPYTASLQQGLKMRVDGVTIDDVGLRPSRLQLSQLMAIIGALPAEGTTQTPEQMRDLLGKVAGLYEGIRIGGIEMRGFSMETPQGPFGMSSLKLTNLENGKIAEFAMEGLDAKAPQGPVKVGRFALKGIDVANLMRTSAQLSATTHEPAADQLAALLLLLEGAEISKLVAPYKNTGKPVNIDTLKLSWGQFVGPLPTKARVTLKMSGPVDESDPDPFKMLAMAGISDASLDFDLGAAWSESAHTFALEPATVEMGGVGRTSIHVSLANVAREVFSLNPLQLAIMAAQIEAGPLEITMQDAGGIDLALAQQASQQGISKDAARQALTDDVREAATQMAADNPDVKVIADAVIRFIENPRSTLTIKLTPKGKIAMMQLAEAIKTNPIATLARFQVEATSER